MRRRRTDRHHCPRVIGLCEHREIYHRLCSYHLALISCGPIQREGSISESYEVGAL